MSWVRRNYNLIFIGMVWILTITYTISSLYVIHEREFAVFGKYDGDRTVPWFTSTMISEIASNLLTAIFFTAFLIYFHKRIPNYSSDSEE